VTLSTPDGLKADLPVASCPCDGRNLLFVLRDRPDDPFVRHAFDHLAPSQNLIVSGPYGDFSLGDDAAAPLLFVAFDLGIAPIKSLIEQAMALDKAPRMDLYRTDSSDGRGYLDRLWRSWQDALEGFRYVPLPREASPEQVLARIAADLPEPGASDCYVAGPRRAIEVFREKAPGYALTPSRMRWDVIA
jgi:CDP-4-dehydro-6-deoxyglucose reductase